MARNIFNTVKVDMPTHNSFDLSHDVKTTLDQGELVPIMVMEAVPGDKVKLAASALLRYQALIAPVMHRQSVYIHYFFVPNRLVWDNWEKFITDTEEVAAPAHPYIDLDAENHSRLMDYMFIPPPNQPDPDPERISPMALAAYQCVYNNYYRDQNLVPEVPYKLVDGDNTSAVPELGALRNRAWEHDYFTAALPFAQKGQAVDIPLGNIELDEDWVAAGNNPQFLRDEGTLPTDGNISVDAGRVEDSAGNPVAYDPGGSLTVESTTISTLRRAFSIQRFFEKLARSGSRYFEWIKGIFGVHVRDERLQRPEYITGSMTPIVISEVLNTAGGDLPQGNMAGHGVAGVNPNPGFYAVKEHGFIIGIMSVIPRTAYGQGIDPMYLKQDKYDYYLPDFAHIGEQPVLNKELYAWQGANGQNTFGYVPRYAQYKYMPSRFTAGMRGSLAFWHQGRLFENPPTLSQEFIECNPDDRIFAVEDAEDKLVCHVYNEVRANRLMPVYGNPI